MPPQCPLAAPARPARPVLLCIDDDACVREALTLVLERSGYSVLAASDGCEGLELFGSRVVDLVVLDYEMPGMNGMETAMEIKRRRPDMPIVMNSGAAEIPGRALETIDVFILKGEYNHLLEAIETLLGGRRNCIAC